MTNRCRYSWLPLSERPSCPLRMELGEFFLTKRLLMISTYPTMFIANVFAPLLRLNSTSPAWGILFLPYKE
jgi:hypothetical protein